MLQAGGRAGRVVVGRGVAGRGAGAAGGSGGVGCVVERCGVVGADRVGLGAAKRVAHGRPTISMATFVRLMVIKQRTGWGYETLMREVSDSMHLRRFCLIALGERVPDESTVRKLTRRLGAEVVNEITRVVIDDGQAGEAVPSAGGEDRLDCGGGGRALSRPIRGWR